MMWRAAKLFSVLVACQVFVFIHAQDRSVYLEQFDLLQYKTHKQSIQCEEFLLIRSLSDKYMRKDFNAFDKSIDEKCQNCCSKIKAPFYTYSGTLCNCADINDVKDRKTIAKSEGMSFENYKNLSTKDRKRLTDRRSRNKKKRTSKRAGPSNQVQDSHSIQSQSTEQVYNAHQGQPTSAGGQEGSSYHLHTMDLPTNKFLSSSQENNLDEVFSQHEVYSQFDLLGSELFGLQQDPPESEKERLQIEDSEQRDNNNMSPIQMLVNPDNISQFYIDSQPFYMSRGQADASRWQRDVMNTNQGSSSAYQNEYEGSAQKVMRAKRRKNI